MYYVVVSACPRVGNFHWRGFPLIWFLIGLGPAELAVVAGGVVWMFCFPIICHFSSFLYLFGRRQGID